MAPKHLTLTAASIALAAALAGCSSPDFPTDPAPPAWVDFSPTAAPSASATDISFAQLMIPHHEQAIEMADLALTTTSTKDVVGLAAQIKGAQGSEIQQMIQWLAEWGAPRSAPSGGTTGHSHGDMGGMGGAGMMSAQDMAALRAAAGDAFDTMWLEMMIAHHEGAIVMAREASVSAIPEVATMARSIILGQTAEIATMKDLLAKEGNAVP